MLPMLDITRGGVFTTVQDLGRPGLLRQGVPDSGALDPPTLRLINHLVGNQEDRAGLEFLVEGPEIACRAATTRLAVAGAPSTVTRIDGRRERLRPFLSTTLHYGDHLAVGRPEGAGCGYIAISGGLAIAPVLGSLSTYIRGSFGGLSGRPLRAGDRLPLERFKSPAGPERVLPVVPDLYGQGPIRVVLGPQADAFTGEAIATFLSSEYRLGRDSDRVGIRLEGPELEHIAGFEVLSEGIAAGAIQVPGTCQPIILLGDRQTIGGYAKIATVISTDLPRIGRLAAGDRIRFASVERSDAEAIARRFEQCFKALSAEITDAPPLGEAKDEQLAAAQIAGSATDAWRDWGMGEA